MAHEFCRNGDVLYRKDFVTVKSDTERSRHDFESFFVEDENIVRIEAEILKAGLMGCRDNSGELIEKAQCLPCIERAMGPQPCSQCDGPN